MAEALAATVVPRLARGVRLRHDPARDAWVLLAPERVLKADPVAVEILKRIDGQTTLGDIVEDLARHFSAERSRIDSDVRDFLTDLGDKGFVEFGR